MATEVFLPRVDMDMTEAVITNWFAVDGAAISQGDPLFEIETSKAAMEIEAPASGTLRLNPEAAAGRKLPVGSVIGWILAAGEAFNRVPVNQEFEAKAGQPEPAPKAAAPKVAEAPPTTRRSAALRATPLARRLARDLGVELGEVQGSGPRGRVTARDLRARAPVAETAPIKPPEKLQPAPAPAVRRDPEALHLLRGGRRDAPLVVFLHGYGSEAEAWRPVATRLAEAWATAAIDLPGHGRSPVIGGASFESLAEHVAATIRTETREPVHLAGHSLGGALAAHLAGEGLVNAASLLLVAPAGLGPEIDAAFFAGFLRARSPASLRPWLERLVADPGQISQGMVRSVLEQHADPARLGFREALAASLFPDGTQAIRVEGTLSRLGIPARIVWGRRDAIIPWRQALQAPWSTGINLLPDAGHMPHVEAAAELGRLAGELARSGESR